MMRKLFVGPAYKARKRAKGGDEVRLSALAILAMAVLSLLPLLHVLSTLVNIVS
jgi:hypothetical protein